jgi:hypothetical protein
MYYMGINKNLVHQFGDQTKFATAVVELLMMGGRAPETC